MILSRARVTILSRLSAKSMSAAQLGASLTTLKLMQDNQAILCKTLPNAEPNPMNAMWVITPKGVDLLAAYERENAKSTTYRTNGKDRSLTHWARATKGDLVAVPNTNKILELIEPCSSWPEGDGWYAKGYRRMASSGRLSTELSVVRFVV